MAHRIKNVNKLTLADMIREPETYVGLEEGLLQLPVPDEIRIGKKLLTVPQSLDEFTGNICYGQRLYFSKEEPNDFAIIIRFIAGYYFPQITGERWDEEKISGIVKNVISCNAIQLYPVSMHLVNLTGEMAEREKALLYREPSKMEKAAGIEKLNVFSELSSLDFLRDTMKVPVSEVLQTPYNEILVRFMMAKEMYDYQERYMELLKAESESKTYKTRKR